ncbi:DegV family protein [Texcoconibacillus texcoconensis]|uniref:DegV family protein with EDD domain n=1 Tax=Texcoconibacillus texcoconensis TaxID=1095777 RepID=A0A840QR07_9BACI|nr:DegV family protein [Texcoconibacillus texcoconensis]MBB5173768.1 DegV family protein with EDD domain [Texcoconibacillus texcoconensis]
MRKTAFITDSTAYISEETRQQKGITMVPLNVTFGNETYQELTELTTDDFYEKIKHADELPTTSQPAIGIFVEQLEQLAKDNDDIIIVTLSSGISGTYQSAHTAADMVEDANVHVFDSEVSCMPQGFYALKAADMAQQGSSAEDIMQALETMRANTRAYFMVDDLNHLHRGGRLNGAQKIVGSLLQIKPILHFEDKVIVPYEKVRTEKKALARIFDLLAEDAQDDSALDIVVIHANREQKADELIDKLKNQYPNAHVHKSYFGPVIGTHLGEGSLGIGWVKSS